MTVFLELYNICKKGATTKEDNTLRQIAKKVNSLLFNNKYYMYSISLSGDIITLKLKRSNEQRVVKIYLDAFKNFEIEIYDSHLNVVVECISWRTK